MKKPGTLRRLLGYIGRSRFALIGVFVFAGYAPDTALVSGIAERDARGYIITDENQKTSVEGLYAAGDICVKPLRQVITAASDGAVAAAALEKYCAALRGEACL